jgi:hypothetical protein
MHVVTVSDYHAIAVKYIKKHSLDLGVNVIQFLNS